MSDSFTIFPAILMAIASVLVDATVRPDLYLDRIKFQTFLWLAVSLQKMDGFENTAMFIHLVFLSSIFSAVARAFRIYHCFATMDPHRPDFSRFLAPSILIAMIFSFVTAPKYNSGEPNTRYWFFSIVPFGAAFVGISGWRWHGYQRKKTRHELRGLPLVTSTVELSMRSLDEKDWPDWTPSDVLVWISTLDDDVRGVDWRNISRILAPQLISGSTLDRLTTNELQTMGLPYGPAVCLSDKIRALRTSYPARRGTTSCYPPATQNGHQDMLVAEGWVDDSEFFKSSSASAVLHEPVDKVSVRRAQEIFHDRYGLELPDMPAASEQRPPSTSIEPGTPPLPQTGQVNASGEVTSMADQEPFDRIPPELMESMPKHIRDIANRKPGLVKELLQLRQEKEEKAAATSEMSPAERLRLQNEDYLKKRTGAQARAEMEGIMAPQETGATMEEQDDMEEQNEDGERTELLRRRKARLRYSAIR